MTGYELDTKKRNQREGLVTLVVKRFNINRRVGGYVVRAVG